MIGGLCSFLAHSSPSNVFPIPEIIYDPTLVLSPHVFLLGMLFQVQAFKSPSIDSPERLYSLGVLDGLNEQALPLREELDDNFIFCQAVRGAHGIRIAPEVPLSSASIRYRMKKGGQIMGCAQVVKPRRKRSVQMTLLPPTHLLTCDAYLQRTSADLSRISYFSMPASTPTSSTTLIGGSMSLLRKYIAA
jgi:Protein of unknown function (DUF3435)